MASRQFSVSKDDPVFDAADTDPTASPATDFYRWVNGGWIDTNPVPAEYGAWGAIQEVHERNQEILRGLLEEAAAVDPATDDITRDVGVYYRSGMDTDTIEERGVDPIRERLAAIDAVADIDDLRDLTAAFHLTGIGVLFDASVIPDFEDATRNLLYVSQGGLGLPDRDYYFRDDETSRQLLADYETHIAAMLDLLGVDGDGASLAATVLDIERSIADASYTNVQMRDVDLVTNKHSIADADGLMPKFSIRRYVETLGAGDENAVNIDNVGMYPALDEMLTTRPVEEWKAYFTWHLLRSVASSLPQRFDDESFDFYGRKLGGQQEQKVRWKRVLAAGSGDIGQLISQLYVRDHFSPESKAAVEHLVDRLFDAMRTTLEDVTWMGDETRAKALQKLEAFGCKIGYPDEWRDYTGLSLSEGKWLENRLEARRFEVARKLGQLGQPVDPHEWSMAPHIVNAYYSPLRNEIVFPAGILQPPFFTAEADAAVNYGAIGAVIGHEITHGFDDQGSRFDANGNVRNWWTEEDRSEFETRAAVMVEQFNDYEIEPGLNVNGELTLGENIADLGGLKIALKALLAELDGATEDVEGLTAEQRFFMAWARAWRRNYTEEYQRLLVNSDPHAPSHLRCSGPMGNMDSFAEAFDLAVDNPQMRPVGDRVDIW